MRATERRGSDLGAAARLGRADRLRAWVVTGPIGRFAAIVIEVAAALGQVLRRRRSRWSRRL